jgi:DNA-binding winged helix-turn-helix (wHTH) protein
MSSDREINSAEFDNPVGETLAARESKILASSNQGFSNKNRAWILNISSEVVSNSGIHRTLRFGPFELSGSKRVLWCNGVALPLGSRAFDILAYLAERPGAVIGKKELIDHVWPDVTVEDGNLRVHVAAIRKALRDGQFGDRYIANVKGRGYSFIASVVRLEASTEQVADQPYKIRRRRILTLSDIRQRRSMLRSVRLR